MRHEVTLFRPYPFTVGQKIRIEGTSRAGDWEIAAITKDKVTLRCPISDRRFEWKIFCYAVETKADIPWPMQD